MIKVEIKDLQVGDEIIISGNSKLKYLKVLKTPVISDKKLWDRVQLSDGTFDWQQTKLKYKSVRCSTLQKQTPYKTGYGKDAIYKSYEFEEDVTKHNIKISIDLNGRDIYLVKREN